jgi:hypothetical protein
MFFRFKYVLNAVLVITGAICSNAQGGNNIPEYHLHVQFNPAQSLIAGKVEIKNPCDSIFLIAKSMEIIKVTADGREASFVRSLCKDCEYSTELVIPGKLPKNLMISYSGQILPGAYPKTISALNMIDSGLVELSDHIDWFPRSKSNTPFRLKLDVEMPSGFTTIANGILRNQKAAGRFIRTDWESDAPVYGITLISAPGMHKSQISGDGMHVEVYFSRLPESYAKSMKADLLKTLKRYTSLFGCPPSHNLVRVVYSPRSAGGYARAPLILVSENFALEQINQKSGPARDFRLNAHEIAHYWSRAEVGTYDDWINEGLAEYSALLMSEKIIGKEFSDILLDEYKGIVNSSPTSYSIAETPEDSRDREVNRYYRPVLLLKDLRNQYGDDRMNSFFKALYIRFSISGKATTALFLDEVKSSFGTETGESFSEALYKKGSQQEKKAENIFVSPADTIFAGRWEGPLSQFGNTVRFVLNLKYDSGKLLPSLDSPDQNVTGIPLTDLIIKGDSISFRIGIASAIYKGVMEKGNNIIQGKFFQRGGTYTLNLSRE